MTNITQEDKDIIFACKESALFNDNSPWVKREGEEFNVTVGREQIQLTSSDSSPSLLTLKNSIFGISTDS